MPGRKSFTSRNKDGAPRKLRKTTNKRAARRQANKIVAARGGKMGSKDFVHHKDGNPLNNSPANLKKMGSHKAHTAIHPGK